MRGCVQGSSKAVAPAGLPLEEYNELKGLADSLRDRHLAGSDARSRYYAPVACAHKALQAQAPLLPSMHLTLGRQWDRSCELCVLHHLQTIGAHKALQPPAPLDPLNASRVWRAVGQKL